MYTSVGRPSPLVIAGLAQRFWDFIKELLQQRAVRSYSNVARAVFTFAHAPAGV